MEQPSIYPGIGSDPDPSDPSISISGHLETWPLNHEMFEHILHQHFYSEFNTSPNSQALKEAIFSLKGKALFYKKIHPVFLRVGKHKDSIYLDLANEKCEAVEVNKDRYRIIETPPVYFRRASSMYPLPRPIQGGVIDELRPFLNISDDKDWFLLVGWLMGALHPAGPYPILILQGDPGSAKSTATTMLRSLIDPSKANLLAMPKNEQDLFILALNTRILTFDNLSGLKPWASDAFCRLSTGAAQMSRMLFSNFDTALISAARPMILNGIDDISTREDLAERAIIITLAPIPQSQRHDDQLLPQKFEEAKPRILGALLAGLVTALSN